jgi:NAD(P)-dependent dehydrogenase (short-subunit alcohol dehydrogenase family)
MTDAARSQGELSGWRVIVTGGSSGIGLATARRMTAAGARALSLDLAAPAASEGLEWQRCDVADDATVRDAVRAALDRLGGLDVLVNNAGIGAQGTVEDNPDEEWRRVFEINVFGAVRVTRAVLPALRASARAAIVNTCSVAADVGLPSRAVYSASKGAVLALTRAMAADHLAEGIRVNCVSPGTVDTPWVGRLLGAAADPTAERAALVARQPHGRLVSAEEVAAAICYLAGPSAGSTTGTELMVDGGLLALRLRGPVPR